MHYVQVIITHTLGNDAKNEDKYAKAIRWCKEVFSTFRIEERRKVGTTYKSSCYLGICHFYFVNFRCLGLGHIALTGAIQRLL